MTSAVNRGSCDMKKILIVDDASFMRMMIRDIVVSLGHHVVDEAENGEDAIEKYKQHQPDLVTMDLVMPKASGIDGLKGIKALNPQAKVIVVSAVDQRESLMEAIRSGAIDFIVKPFDEERVINAIRKALEEKC